ncbi:hypothetical protein EQG49_13065 [Periweissella cryptocerci]|uniref:Uncharacterized protein n=1 Tax=Periweissella cryptocerci TaxID=2506420 RepID=A0A4P6YX00_9LACO|nr:InlB B-repeat-containing protein [Periweissella cryptocerci]QBO37326.1 hypothetical protein EQG49_13065 [Periweissella cryptocerci]
MKKIFAMLILVITMVVCFEPVMTYFHSNSDSNKHVKVAADDVKILDFTIHKTEQDNGAAKYTIIDPVITDELEHIGSITIEFPKELTLVPATLPAGWKSQTQGGNVYNYINTANGTANNQAEVKNFLSALAFTSKQTVGGDIKITLEGGKIATWVDGEGNKHYYEFVEAQGSGKAVTWLQAYNLAKQMEYRGLQGYLATITSTEEHQFIFDSIATNPGWLGGTRMRKLTANGPQKIVDDQQLTEAKSNGTDIREALYYGNKLSTNYGVFTWANTDSAASKAQTTWYWADGPEAGQDFLSRPTYQLYTDDRIAGTEATLAYNNKNQTQQIFRGANTLGDGYNAWARDDNEPNNYHKNNDRTSPNGSLVSIPNFSGDTGTNTSYDGEYVLQFGKLSTGNTKVPRPAWNDRPQWSYDTTYNQGYYVEFSEYNNQKAEETQAVKEVPLQPYIRLKYLDVFGQSLGKDDVLLLNDDDIDIELNDEFKFLPEHLYRTDNKGKEIKFTIDKIISSNQNDVLKTANDKITELFLAFSGQDQYKRTVEIIYNPPTDLAYQYMFNPKGGEFAKDSLKYVGNDKVAPVMYGQMLSGATDITFPTVTRPGYEFKGWHDTKSKTADSIYVKPAQYLLLGDTCLEAIWEKVYYTVTFASDNDSTVKIGDNRNATPSSVATSQVEYGTLAETVRAAKSTHAWKSKNATYETGWYYKDGDRNVPVDLTSYQVTHDVTFYPIFTESAMTVHINYDANGGEFAASVGAPAPVKGVRTYEYAYKGKLLAYDKAQNPTRPGYTFTGWFDSAGKRINFADAKYQTLIADYTFYAGWEPQLVLPFTGEAPNHKRLLAVAIGSSIAMLAIIGLWIRKQKSV